MDYDFDEVIDRHGTFCTQWDYIEDRFGQPDLLPFSISDTDFRVPRPVAKRIAEVASHEVYGYTRWNHHAFKGAVRDYFERRFACETCEDWVVYSPSVMYSVAVLLRLLSEPGEGVVTFDPMYDAFLNVVPKNGRVLVPCELAVDADGAYHINYDALEEALDRARVLLLCSPHNPTGRMWMYEELVRIVELCRERDVRIISDEIHMDVSVCGRRNTPILSFYEDYPELYLASSCTKTFNTPGLIGSYVLIPNDSVRTGFLDQTRRRDFLNSASVFGMHAHMVGYTECDDYVDQLCDYIKGNMALVREYLELELPEFRYRVADATYLAWIDGRRCPWSSRTIQDALVNVGKVAIMAGETYGPGGEGWLRMNLGCPRSKVEEGLGRFKHAVEWLRAGGANGREGE